MGKCVVVTCEKEGKHRFPTDETLKQQWIRATRVDRHRKIGWHLRKSSSICSDHFTLNDYYVQSIYSSRKTLKRKSIPSIFPWTSPAPQELSQASPPPFNPKNANKNYSKSELPTKFVEEYAYCNIEVSGPNLDPLKIKKECNDLSEKNVLLSNESHIEHNDKCSHENQSTVPDAIHMEITVDSDDQYQHTLKEVSSEQDYLEMPVIKAEPEEDPVQESNSFLVETSKQTLNRQQSINIKKENVEEPYIISPSKKTEARGGSNIPILSQNDFDKGSVVYDDIDLYGKLITKKLRAYAVYERNLIMSTIDALIIKHPPGFNTSTEKMLKKVTKKKGLITSKQTLEYTNNDYSGTHLSPQLKTQSTIELSSVSSTSLLPEMQTKSTTNLPSKTKPGKLQPAISSSNVSEKKFIIRSIPNKQQKVIKRVNLLEAFKPFKNISKGLKQQLNILESKKPVKAPNNIPIKSDVTSPSDQSSKATVPLHLPLKIIIPQNMLYSHTASQFVPSSFQKGKILISKSKSFNYVPSSIQPPILITAPTVSHSSKPLRDNTDKRLGNNNIKVDFNEFVSKEGESTAPNIVETSLKNGNIAKDG